MKKRTNHSAEFKTKVVLDAPFKCEKWSCYWEESSAVQMEVDFLKRSVGEIAKEDRLFRKWTKNKIFFIHLINFYKIDLY